jgi:zinc transport system substrate-binding protein
MNKSKLILLFTVILFAVFGIFTLIKKENTIPNKKVAATIFPLCDIVRNVAGNKVKVTCILPPGASPHTFDPSPQEVKKVIGSSVLFSIGNGLDNWSQDFAKSADIKKVVVVDKNISLIDSTHEHGEEEHDTDLEHSHEASGSDPHYWLSVPNAILISSQVKDELITLFPEYSSEFETNYSSYKLVLTKLQNEINSDLEKLPNKEISTFHNAWGYFARDHGLDIATTFEEYPGEEPTSEYLKDFQNQIRNSGISVIFSEPQFSTKPLEPIAGDLGVDISVLDPIGGVSGRDSYDALMRFNANNIVKALQ